MSVLVIIQARMQSHRFPSKVLAYLKGKPLIDRIVEAVPREYLTMIASGPASTNLPLGRYCHAQGYHFVYVKGCPESDVLTRFAQLTYRDIGTIVRLTADCPLHSPDVIRRTVDAFRPEMGYLFSHWLWDLPKGQEVEVFTRALLLKANAEATSPYDREHVTPWMRRHVGDRQTRYTDVNYSVDTVDDLHRLEGMAWP